MTKSIHIPVMLDKVLNFLKGGKRQVILDCTFGGGGHSKEILKRFENVKVVGIDRDLEAIKRGEMLLNDFPERLYLYHQNFKEAPSLLKTLGISQVDAVLMDLGVSSDLIENGERGFSFQKDGPLDMRMDQSSELTAEIVVNSYPKERLEKIFKDYGEERFAKRVAEAICDYRRKKRITSTLELTKIIQSVIKKRERIHPATRIFQALRIEVNNELNSLREFLQNAPHILKEGGRILVISFHSLEDRIVKNMFKEYERAGIFKILTKKPEKPTYSEIRWNKRARSAKLRVAEKVATGGIDENS